MDLVTQSDAEILAVVTPIMDNLMAASTAVDYDAHTRDFTERAKCALSEVALKTICAQYQSTRGSFASRKFVAVFRRPESIAVVWRQWFTKAPGEFVAELVLVQKDGEYRVDHVMVF